MKILYFTVLLAMLTGCHNHLHDKNQHVARQVKYEYKSVVQQYTVYNDGYELFAESSPFIVGHETKLLVHLTELVDFTPLAGAKVQLMLVVQNDTLVQESSTSIREGIYPFSLQALRAGEGNLNLVITSKQQVVSKLNMGTVPVYASTHDVVHIKQHELASDAIFFSKEQAWNLDFETTLPKQNQLGKVIHTVAQVQLSPQNEITVVARTNGVVSFPVKHMLPGRSVHKEETLFLISSNNLSENNAAVHYKLAQNEFEASEQEFLRYQSLFESHLVSKSQFIDAKLTYYNAKSVYENLKKSFDGNGHKVTAPISGYVKKVLVSNGDYVETGQEIVILEQPEDLILQADLPQKYAMLLPKLSSANIYNPLLKESFSLMSLGGKIVSYGKSASTPNYRIPISLCIQNTAGFVPGIFVDIYLKATDETQVMSIPNTALLERQGVYSVYVQLTPELFQRRQVRIGTTDGINTAVLSGLLPTERIVSKGAIFVKLSKASGTLDAHSGHVH